MTRRMFIAAISLVMALQAQQLLPSGTVKGVVTAAGKPVPAVKIVFSSGADSSYAASTTTDTDGTFSVAQVPVGSVELRVFGPDGKLAVSGKGELKAAGDVLTLPIQLP